MVCQEWTQYMACCKHPRFNRCLKVDICLCVCVGYASLYTCVFFRYRTFVSEDAGPNTLVATVLAKDPDGDGITYKISAGNEEGNFVIDSQKGEPCYFNIFFLNQLRSYLCYTVH